MIRRNNRTWILLAVLVLGGSAVAAGMSLWSYWGRAPAQSTKLEYPPLREQRPPASQSQQEPVPALDPRLQYAGPYQNVDPAVPYVGDAQCAKCHEDVAESYRRHPMARTLTPVDRFSSPPLDARAHNPFSALGAQFQVVPRSDRVWHVRRALAEDGKPLFQSELEVHLAVGSGARAHSFLSLHDSMVLQTPITWYSQRRAWDLSPGFHLNLLAGRRVGADCLFCHSNGANEDPREETRYNKPIFPNGHGIGCERCHGPGGKHVESPGLVDTAQGRLDPTIVNPARLSPRLRDEICWQCHLEGEVRILRRGRRRFDFRPGLPLAEFINVFEEPAEASYEHVVNHVEQMWQSRCYKQSAGAGQMGCTTCHNPHESPAPENKVAVYRAACLKCHETQGCALELADRQARQQDDSCVACHMPAFAAADVVHVSSTDHRIPRLPTRRKPDERPARKGKLMQELVSLFEPHWAQGDPELNRDRALASGMFARQGRYMAKPLLQEFEQAIQRDADDLPVKAQYGLELINRGKADQALPLLRDVMARQPDNEFGGYGFALACTLTNRNLESLPAWRRLIELAPSHFGYRLGLAEALFKEGMFSEAEQVARDWVKYDPGMPEARMVLRDSLDRLGRVDEAKEQHRLLTELLRARERNETPSNSSEVSPK